MFVRNNYFDYQPNVVMAVTCLDVSVFITYVNHDTRFCFLITKPILHNGNVHVLVTLSVLLAKHENIKYRYPVVEFLFSK